MCTYFELQQKSIVITIWEAYTSLEKAWEDRKKGEEREKEGKLKLNQGERKEGV